MFTAAYDDSSGYTLPLAPYGIGGEPVEDASSEAMRFRRQRLELYLASNLFTSGYGGAAGVVKDKPLTTMTRGKRISYSGEILDQWDQDVLLHCAMKAAVSSEGQITVDPAELLRTLSMRNAERNRDRVFESLHRLHLGSIEVAGERYTYMTRLINRVLLDRGRRFCLLEVNADLVASLRRSPRLALDVRDRLPLGRNGLAKWLHGLLMVYRAGFSADVSYLHDLCGHKDKAKAFPGHLTKALDELRQAGLVTSFELDETATRVVAQTAETQQVYCGFIGKAQASS